MLLASYLNMFMLYNKPTDSLIFGELEELNKSGYFLYFQDRERLFSSVNNI